MATEEKDDQRRPGREIWRRGQQDTSTAGRRWGGEAQSRAEDGEVSFVACVPLAVARLTS